jgi:methionine-rich copper-binding protein CopC
MFNQFKLVRRAVLCGTFVIASAVLVQGHTKLEKSEPAAGAALDTAPRLIQLWFNETVDVAVSKIELKSAAGKIDLAPAHAMGGKSLMAGITEKMAAGSYTVTWQTAGDDGHVVKGDFTFSVKAH